MLAPGLEIRLRQTHDSITAELQQLQQVKNLKKPLTEIGRNLVTSTRKRFQQSQGPVDVLGSPKAWKPLKPGTIARRRQGSSKPLVDTTTLLRSVQSQVIENTLHVGTNHEIAPGVTPAIHQLGGLPHMAPGPAGIPARPFLGIDHEDFEMISHVVTGYVQSLGAH